MGVTEVDTIFFNLILIHLMLKVIFPPSSTKFLAVSSCRCWLFVQPVLEIFSACIWGQRVLEIDWKDTNVPHMRVDYNEIKAQPVGQAKRQKKREKNPKRVCRQFVACWRVRKPF